MTSVREAYEAVKMAAELLAHAGLSRPDILLGCSWTEAEVDELARLVGVKVESALYERNIITRRPYVIFSCSFWIGEVSIRAQGNRPAVRSDAAEGMFVTHEPHTSTPEEALAALAEVAS